MSEEWPKIRSRHTTVLSRWMRVIQREVEFAPGAASEAFYAVEQSDYVAIVALTPDGRIPIVRQFRPAVECFTWELPAGLVEEAEDPIATCRRELIEETGFPAREVVPLGIAAPCTGRLSNRIHSFFAETGERVLDFVPENGLTVTAVAPHELARLILAGEFVSQLHLGALLLAKLRSFLPTLTLP